MIETEIPLSGGNVNSGVVRVGSTVRRATTDASPTVHAFLDHLHASGFSACPEYLGIDQKQREILSYIEGDTGVPRIFWEKDESLLATATMLKNFHEASASFKRCNSAIWAYSYPDSEQHEVVCHNDFAPYNFVYSSNSIPVAIIDFDLAGPGPRLRDVAYAAYWLTPLSTHSDDMVAYAKADVVAGCRRLKLFCSQYGIEVSPALLDMVNDVLLHMANEQVAISMLGIDVARKLKEGGHLSHWANEATAFKVHRTELEDVLFRSGER